MLISSNQVANKENAHGVEMDGKKKADLISLCFIYIAEEQYSTAGDDYV